MKKNRVIVLLLVLIAGIVLSSCRSQERFGQRKAPKNCHTCTRWGK